LRRTRQFKFLKIKRMKEQITMYKINEIKELIRAVDRSTIGELVVSGENKQKLSIKKQGSGVAAEASFAPATPVAQTPVVESDTVEQVSAPVKEETLTAPLEVEESLQKIVSPMVGTFYAAPSPDEDNYVNIGKKVTTESIVCIVEAMKLMNELEAEVTGEIVEILVEDGQLVEYGQPLFLVKA
jgi:acetyl-CoA carboxylase biotin carboxyl carrier protein